MRNSSELWGEVWVHSVGLPAPLDQWVGDGVNLLGAGWEEAENKRDMSTSPGSDTGTVMILGTDALGFG